MSTDEQMIKDNIKYVRSQFTISNQQNDFMKNNNITFNNNITSAINEFILLDQCYFIVEYNVGFSGNSTAGAEKYCNLNSNWFLSMIQSLNMRVGNITQQMTTISYGKTLPQLANINRALRYDYNDFLRHSQMEDSSLITNVLDKSISSTNQSVLRFNDGRYYYKNTSGNNQYKDYIILRLKDFIPLVDTSSTVSGLISFNINLSFDKTIQFKLSTDVNQIYPDEFSIIKINFHYTTGVCSNIMNDLLLNPYNLTLNVIPGTIPNNYFISIKNGSYEPSQIQTEVFYSNLQLSQNAIRYLYIIPRLQKTTSNNTNTKLSIYNKNPYVKKAFISTDYEIGALSNLDTQINQIGSPYFGYKNIKITINGSQIAPSNIVQQYENSFMADYYNYLFSFIEDSSTEQSNYNCLPYEIYSNGFKPIIVNLKNFTKFNTLSQCSIQFTFYNLYKMLAQNGDINTELVVDYFILHEIEYGNTD